MGGAGQLPPNPPSYPRRSCQTAPLSECVDGPQAQAIVATELAQHAIAAGVDSDGGELEAEGVEGPDGHRRDLDAVEALRRHERADGQAQALAEAVVQRRHGAQI